MIVGGYQLDLLVQGYPGKSATHGGLGWSGVVLLRGHGHQALIDVGSFGQRRIVLAGLAAHGVEPSAITDVVMSHAHHDHATNWVMFPSARIVIGGSELEWALTVPSGTPVPELYVRELARSDRLETARDGDLVLPGFTAHLTPGHTPGHLVFVVAGEDHDVILSGDAAKNRAELLAREADMTYDAEQTRRSIDAIWDLWRGRPGNIVMPGHDVPMVLDRGRPAYVGPRDASIASWFGDDMSSTTTFDLTRDG
jgi:N-acyl homoserine lactone hydrolase